MKKIIIRNDHTGTTKYYIEQKDGKDVLKQMVRNFVPGINLSKVVSIELVDTI